MELIKQFGLCSEEYLKIRPTYPSKLFNWISSITPYHEVALDCGTGNGQAAFELTKFFKSVVAIDANHNQLKLAISHPKIKYHCMRAEKISLIDASVDLIISASAVHWFELDKFYSECRRLLKPQGRIVVWTYTWPQTDNLVVSKELTNIKRILQPYWSKATLLHINKYKDLPFPFTLLKSPGFCFEINWSIEQILCFFSTWAGIREYMQTIDTNLLDNMRTRLSHLWPNKCKQICFKFPLYLKAGKLL